MSNINACLSHNTDDWKTPSNLYKAMLDQGYMDPCPYMADFDGLQRSYKNQKLYVNPPFSKLNDWVDWCLKQYFNGCEVFLLMPSRTDTKYFLRLYHVLPIFYCIQGRLHFNDSKASAPFPTMIVHLTHNSDFKGRVICSDLDTFIRCHVYGVWDYGPLG